MNVDGGMGNVEVIGNPNSFLNLRLNFYSTLLFFHFSHELFKDLYQLKFAEAIQEQKTRAGLIHTKPFYRSTC